MGCGESKHAVATQNTITKSKSRSRSMKQEQKAPPTSTYAEMISKNDGYIGANYVKDSDKSNVKINEISDVEIPKKIDKNEGAAVSDLNIESEVKTEENEIKNGKENVKVKKEDAAAAEVVEVVQEKKEEIKNEEPMGKKQEEVEVEVVKEKQEEEIKNEELKEENKDELKAAGDQEEKENVVSHDATLDDSSRAKIEENEGKEEGVLKVEKSTELDQETKPSAQEKAPADQTIISQEEGDATAAAPPSTDVNSN